DVPTYSSSDSDEGSDSDSETCVPFRVPRRRRRKHRQQAVPEASSLREVVSQVVKEVLATHQAAVPVASVARTPSPKRVNLQRRRTCWICHSPQHIQRYCPHRIPYHFYPQHPSFDASPYSPMYRQHFPSFNYSGAQQFG